jgi:hypothetical protein
MMAFYEKCCTIFGGSTIDINTFDDVKEKVAHLALYMDQQFQMKYSIPGKKPLESYLYVRPLQNKLKYTSNKLTVGIKHLHSNEQNRKKGCVECWPIPIDQSTIIKQWPSKSVIEVTIEEPTNFLIPTDFSYDCYDIYSPQLKDYLSNKLVHGSLYPVEINSVPFAAIRYDEKTATMELIVMCWNFPILFQIVNNPSENVRISIGI